MWAPVVIFAVMAMWDPVRVGVAVFVVARSRPVASLFVFCVGGIASSLAIGLGAVFLLRGTTERFIRDAASTAGSVGAAHVKVMLGGLALLIAVALVVRQRTRMPVPHTGLPDSPRPRASAPTLMSRMSARGRALLQHESLWVAFVAGLWAGPGPHVELIGALGVILASRADAQTQVAAVVVYAVISFAFAEIPLVSYLLAPAKTSAFLNQVPGWLRARRLRVVAAALTILGLYLVATGVWG